MHKIMYKFIQNTQHTHTHTHSNVHKTHGILDTYPSTFELFFLLASNIYLE